MAFSNLRIEKVGQLEYGRQVWQLHEPLSFSLRFDGDASLVVTVPEGFKTDFASVPRLFWVLFPPTGMWCEAAVVHDYLCLHPRCSRFLADAIFREAMYQMGVPLWRRLLMYLAVRAYGALFVHKNLRR